MDWQARWNVWAARLWSLALVMWLITGSVLAACKTDAPSAPPSTNPPPPAAKSVDHSTVSNEIGAEGGTLEHPTGAKIVIPAGALAATTTVSITGIDAPPVYALGGPSLGQGFRMEPEGLLFQKVVTVVVPFDATLLPEGATLAEALVLTAPNGSLRFDVLETTAAATTGRLEAKTMHFSELAAARNPNPVFVTTKSMLAPGMVGTSYGAQFDAIGGMGPYTWEIAPGGVGLPPGIALTSNGSLTGAPTQAGTFVFNVVAADTGTNRVQRLFSILVNPAPMPALLVGALTPQSAVQGSPDTTVAISGTGFVPGSVATWKGTNLTTTYVSPTQVTAVIPSTNLVNVGQTPMGVTNPPPGGPSNTIAFSVNAALQNPLPNLTSINPQGALVGSPDTQITLTGTSFIASSVAVIGAQQLSTTYVSSTQLQAIIPASYLTAATTLQIQVSTPAPGGGTSSFAAFTVAP